jgi:hypothetical protein
MVPIDMRTTTERRLVKLERRARVGAYAPRPRTLLEHLEVCELEALEALAVEHDGLAPADHPLVVAMLSAAQARAAGHLVPALVPERPLQGCTAGPPTEPLSLPPR